MVTTSSLIAGNYNRVQARIEAACRRAGRPTNSVTLVAVTKYARSEWVDDLVALGVRELGESRVAQLVDRASHAPRNVHWHMIGHLQRNKVRSLLPLVTLIHSIDSVRLLERVEHAAVELDLNPRVLLEVNVSGEESKDGFRPNDLQSNWPQILSYRRTRLLGLMTMAPLTSNTDEARVVFAGLRRLRDRLAEQCPPAVSLSELSMGMSSDFEVAVEEGATIVRLGGVLFEGLPEEGPSL